MERNTEWKDYQILATGDGLKLERWKDVYLLRPDPQVIWPAQIDLASYPKLNAKYNRIGGGGKWAYSRYSANRPTRTISSRTARGTTMLMSTLQDISLILW